MPKKPVKFFEVASQDRTAMSARPLPPNVVTTEAIRWAEEWGVWSDLRDTVEFLNRYYPQRNSVYYSQIFSYCKGKGWFGALARMYDVAPPEFRHDILHNVLESQSITAILWLERVAEEPHVQDLCRSTVVLLGGKFYDGKE